MCVQAHREGAHRKADQNAPQRDHDAERPGECHLQGGERLEDEGVKFAFKFLPPQI